MKYLIVVMYMLVAWPALATNLSMDDLLHMAQKGNASAQNEVGLGYAKQGKGADAQGWWQKAADQGDPNAMQNLGLLYGQGMLVPKDPAKARDMFQKAADKGMPTSQTIMAGLYNKDGNKEKARYWLDKAAENGDPTARKIKYTMARDKAAADATGATLGDDSVTPFKVTDGKVMHADPNAAANQNRELASKYNRYHRGSTNAQQMDSQLYNSGNQAMGTVNGWTHR